MINDNGCDVVHHTLPHGSIYEYSYLSNCNSNGRDHHGCDCPNMVNVLRNNRIVRLVNGEERPVHRESVVVRSHAKMSHTVIPGANSDVKGCFMKRPRGLAYRPSVNSSQ